jgi:hypothetical protein
MEIQDLTAKCKADLGTGITVEELRHHFCTVCRRATCGHARFGNSEWLRRILTQEERLLNSPQFAAEDDPVYQAIRSLDFKDIARQAIRMDIAERRGDWSIPDLPGDSVEVAPSPPEAAPETPSGPPETPPGAEDGPDLPPLLKRVPERQKASQEAPEPSPEESSPDLPPRQNIPIPAEGIMVGGEGVPIRERIEPPSVAEKVQKAWGNTSERSLNSGGKTIQLGVKKDG